MANDSLWEALSGLASSDSGGDGATSYPVSSGGEASGVDLSSLNQDPDWGSYLSQLAGSLGGESSGQTAPTSASSAMPSILERAYSDPSRRYDVVPSGGSPMATDPSFGSSVKGWLSRLSEGDKKTEGQAKLGIGALGLLDSFLRSRRAGRGQKSPAELRAMVAGRYNNWTPQQQVSADRYFGGGRQFAYQKPTGMADGGHVRFEPKIGTMGPRRGGQTGEYDREAVLRAIAAANAASAPLPSSSLLGPRTKVRRYGEYNREAARAAGEFAEGGEVDMPALIQGGGGGQEDDVPINASSGEYVIDADAVSALGDGSNEEGARRLDQMVQMLREHKRSAPPSEIPPQAAPPLSYIGSE